MDMETIKANLPLTNVLIGICYIGMVLCLFGFTNAFESGVESAVINEPREVLLTITERMI